jgi:hypothetical protein
MQTRGGSSNVNPHSCLHKLVRRCHILFPLVRRYVSVKMLVRVKDM